MMRNTLAVILALSLGLPALGQLTGLEKQGLTEAQLIGNLDPSSLNFPRMNPDFGAFPLLRTTLDTPQAGLEELLSLSDRSAKLSVSQILKLLREQAFADDPKSSARAAFKSGTLEGLPSELVGPVSALAQAVADANLAVRNATKDLTQEERRKLIEGLPQWCNDEPSIRLEFAKSTRVNRAELANLVAKVDLGLLRNSAMRLAIEIENQLPVLERISLTTKWTGTAAGTLGGVVCEVSGVGDDRHTRKDAMLCLDLGGSNTYLGRYGAGIGYSGVLINFGDNVTYQTGDASAGVGLLGIGMVFELSKDDATIKGKSLTQGTGVAGVGVFLRKGGESRYSATSLAQGFGAWGVGLLLSVAGDDDYAVAFRGQGSARMGGVGWLMDREGDDRYRSGGKVASPVFETATLAKSQGYGEGTEELCGGLGLLTDEFGNDQYTTSDGGQGSGKNGGTGALVDSRGNDVYVAFSHAQGYGLRQGAGYLEDLAGDDRYLVTTGNCQGEGDQFGFGGLLDRAGNDLFTAQDAYPGTGMDYGAGLVMLGTGEHRFTGRPLVGDGSGLGLFVDLGGSSRFGEALVGGGQALARSWESVVYLREISGAVSGLPGLRQRPKPGTQANLPMTEIDALIGRARLGGEDGEVALDKLIEVGKPALSRILSFDLDDTDLRIVEPLVTALDSDGRSILAEVASGENEEKARRALLLARDIGGIEFRPAVAKGLKRAALAEVAAAAAVRIQPPGCDEDLMVLCGSTNKRLVVYALEALTAMNSFQSLSTAQALLGSAEMPVRRAAFRLIASFKPSAAALANSLLTENEEPKVRLGIQFLGSVGTEQALKTVLRFLDDARPGVRISALLALQGRCPLEARPQLLRLQQDSNPIVRAVAARIDPGR